MKKALLFGIILTVCVIIVAFVFAQFYPEGMISYWKFDKPGPAAFDSVDANHGTIYGATWTTGQVNGALSFDGSDDYVEIPSFTFNENGVYSVEFWFYPKATGLQYILDFRVANSASQAATIAFDYHGNREIDYVIYGAGVPWPAPGTIALSLNEWHHVGIIHDSVNNRVISYVDGKKDIDATYSWDFTPIASPLKIGIRSGTYTVPTNGIIDEVAIYNRALSVGEIQQHYLNGSYEVECVLPPSGLVSWWPGDGDATDILGGNDGNLMNGADFTVGKVGQAFYLDGADDYVEVPDATNLDIPGSFTVDAWVRLDELKYISTILTKEHNALPFDVNYNLHILDYKMFFALTFDAGASLLTGSGGCDAGGCYVIGATTLTSSNLGQFLHVAAVYDDTTKTLTVYLNGVKDGEATFFTSGKPMTNVEPIRIGRRNAYSAATNFNGVIDELELFDRALPASEIQAIYNAGSAGKCKKVAPRELKLGAIAKLSKHEYESSRFAKAIEEIDKSLDEYLWLDEMHVIEKDGKKVFDHERHAVKELLHLLKCGGIMRIELKYTGVDPVSVYVYLKDLWLGTFPVSTTNSTFTVKATEATNWKLHPEIRLMISDSEVASFHTSCSRPIAIGDEDGEFVIVDLDKLPPKDAPDITTGALGSVAAAVEDLVLADRILAQTFLDDNTDEFGNPILSAIDPDRQAKVNKELAKAKAEMDKGDAAMKPDKAIHHYKKAWDHVWHAIKESEKLPK